MDNDIILAKDLQQKATDDKIMEAVKRNMQEAKKAAENGDAFCCVYTNGLGLQYKGIILAKLMQYGYKRWPYTVYIGGVPQNGPFFTWREEV